MFELVDEIVETPVDVERVHDLLARLLVRHYQQDPRGPDCRMTTPAYALYRRSRSHQDLSIEEQRQAVRTWAAEHGYAIVREFSDDASGLDTARRREFLALLEICARPDQRHAATVLCYDVSRFSRLDPEEAGFHEYSLRRAGVRVLYTHEAGANEGGVTGHLVKALKRVLAHDYSQKLSQVVSRGLRAHAERGHWTGGIAPYGYRRAVRQPDGTTCLLPPGRWKARGETVVLVVEPIEAAVIRDLYDAYAHQGIGLRALAHRLNIHGVAAPTAVARRGTAAWTKGTLWAILRNSLYTGTLRYAKARYSEIGKKRGKVRRPAAEWVSVSGAVPAIVPEPLWAAAQARHGTRRFGVGRPWHRPYLLSGLIECAHCGKRFRAHKQARGREVAYYLCGGYHDSGPAVCDDLRIPQSYLDEAVLDGIQKRLEQMLDRPALTRRLTELLQATQPPAEAAATVEAQLAQVRRKIGRLVEALADGPEDLPSVRATLAVLERERARLEDQEARTRIVTPPGGPRGLQALTEGLLHELQPCAPYSRRGRWRSAGRSSGASWRGFGLKKQHGRRPSGGSACRVPLRWWS